MNLIVSWFSSKGVLPHGFCYQWNPLVGVAARTSDVLVAAATFLISANYFDSPWQNATCTTALKRLVGRSLAACGMSHAIEV